jgi:hypothetical protein
VAPSPALHIMQLLLTEPMAEKHVSVFGDAFAGLQMTTITTKDTKSHEGSTYKSISS